MENNDKIYILADWQDLSVRRNVTLDEGKEFLKDLLEDELDDDNPYYDEIEEADVERLNSMLGVCEFAIFETEEDYQGSILASSRKIWVTGETFTSKGSFESSQKQFDSKLNNPIFVAVRFDTKSVIVYKSEEEEFLTYDEYWKNLKQREKVVLMYLENDKIIEDEKVLNSLFSESIIIEIRDKFKEFQNVMQ